MRRADPVQQVQAQERFGNIVGHENIDIPDSLIADAHGGHARDLHARHAARSRDRCGADAHRFRAACILFAQDRVARARVDDEARGRGGNYRYSYSQ